jgi:hypothetical protein
MRDEPKLDFPHNFQHIAYSQNRPTKSHRNPSDSFGAGTCRGIEIHRSCIHSYTCMTAVASYRNILFKINIITHEDGCLLACARRYNHTRRRENLKSCLLHVMMLQQLLLVESTFPFKYYYGRPIEARFAISLLIKHPLWLRLSIEAGSIIQTSSLSASSHTLEGYLCVCVSVPVQMLYTHNSNIYIIFLPPALKQMYRVWPTFRRHLVWILAGTGYPNRIFHAFPQTIHVNAWCCALE